MTLHPQSKSFLEAIAAQQGPGWHEVPPAEGRAMFRGLIELFGERSPLERVEDLTAASGLRLRLYSAVSKQPAKPQPLVMFFHGGGWVFGDLDTHDSLCRQLAIETGFTIVAVDYGLAPDNKFPGPLDDCFAAVQFIFEHANELGVDTERVAVVGDSAGGNLAAAVALKSRDANDAFNLKSQVLIYPVISADLETASYREFSTGFGLSQAEMKWFWDQYLDDQTDTTNPLAAPLQADSLVNLPPALVITAEYDVLRDEGEEYAARLADAGVETETKRYDGMLHGFVHLQGIFEHATIAIREIAAELKKRLAS